MKKIIYSLIAACALLAAPACSNDYEDCTSVHVYGETENPPLKGSDAGNITLSISVKQGDTAPITLPLDIYSDRITDALGISYSELISGLADGSVRFLPVNPNRRVWDKTPANNGDNSWYLSAGGVVTTPEEAAVTLTFNPSDFSLVYTPTERASGIIGVTCGFVLTADSSYPVNVRLQNVITILDASMITITGNLPAGDYLTYPIAIADYMDAFSFVFGESNPYNIAAGLGENDYVIIPLDATGNDLSCTPPDDYTANGGYWMDANHEICNWGVANMQYFIEPDVYDWDAEDFLADGGVINIGRAPGWDSGTKVEMSFVVALAKDRSKRITFMCDLTFD